VKAWLDVEEEGRGSELESLEGSDLMTEGERHIKSGEAQKGSALIGVKQPSSAKILSCVLVRPVRPVRWTLQALIT